MKKCIALVTGGFSRESEISYQSAATIEKHIDTDKYQYYLIDISPAGWLYTDEQGEKINIDKNDFSLTLNNQKIVFDTVLMCIHGTPGEDGKLQGYFDMLHIPYTCCNASVSALTFNKRDTIALAGYSGIEVSKSVMLLNHESTIPDEAIKKLQFPVFVKPNNGGSSIGMSKVLKYSEEIGIAIDKAFAEDNQVLVEEFISGRELTIGVFNNGEKIITLPITEIISKNEFFDFNAKYKGESAEITPAEITEEMAEAVRDAAKKIYAIFNCKGIVRIDFIFDEKKNVPVMLEINTVPGQSAASLIPQQVAAMGWNLKEFYTALIEASFLK
ncbi:MAG: D-alanine--D-alanine ligase [Bacteroidetes bacterium]|nr:D-alanine--D-alanine ligase [Bacteroidota bacterium]